MPRNRYYSGPESDHFDGRFHNIAPRTGDKGFADIWRMLRTAERERWPEAVAITPAVPDPRVEGVRVTLIGHASVLIQAAGLNLLTDPVWSERTSPFSFAGPKRVCPPGVAFDDLPKIDAVLLSHNHYDHLDKATLKRLVQRDDPLIVTPLGNDTIVRGAIPNARIWTGDWWDRCDIGGVEATLVPAQHWSSRGIRDRRMALWCGFFVRTGGKSVYFAGDTGYGDGSVFPMIRERMGVPDMALIPIGAYAPRWFMADQHVDPDQAARIFEDVGAAKALAIHWGVFPLSAEGRDTPARELEAALAARGLNAGRFRAAEPGSGVDL